ncbi:Copper chaperone CopZ [Hymenobacter daecheongensis DSM 21074]|uniref:Copper chaperone CopZ n=1 Tax=Hymenobacter daecheongensis DSM 21074 TaxID=1121955 RepID=A0A1M6G153_9BACT|nr:heavy metal-associated domain-containing protein [Hymenobacter daecheongensis]SHJ03604.1 Copper chaperone CopZ [Hymenobacter daecheongensis DSM 21074]
MSSSLKSLFAALLLLCTAQAAQAQAKVKVKAKGPATEQLQLKTSAVCDMCKARLEKALAYEKGVQQATLDVPTQMLTVAYRPDKTSPAALRTAVQRTGYDADDQPAEPRAYDRLPDCCKKTNAIHTGTE